MEPVLQLQNLTKAYGESTAVDDVSLTFESGRFITLLGPSGCGKSTTLRMIGGFETPTGGRILLGNDDITAVPPHRRPVNMVFQDYALFPHLSVRKNISFGLELNGTPKSSIGGKVDDLLGMMQLSEHADKSPHQLSGGQRQRVALARALAPDPKFLLLDEPLSALDAKLRQQMQVELKNLQRQTEKTFILVTHDQSEALSISDVVVVMDRGKIRQVGTPQELYMRPTTEFVARFVGEINILSCDVVGVASGGVTVNWDGLSLLASNPANLDLVQGRKVMAVLRPESIRCSGKPMEGYSNHVGAQVVQKEFGGAQTTLLLRSDGGGAPLSASAASNDALMLPDQVYIAWGEHDLVLLSAD